MKKDRILMVVKGDEVTEHGDGSVSFMGDMAVDADGSPRAYHPDGKSGLDFLANAGSPGNWWGIATNSKGVPFIQGPSDPAPGYYVSTTSLKNPGFRHGDPRREINSEVVPFIVVPIPLIKKVKGVVMGCRATITDIVTGQVVEAVVADAGPANSLGEASIAAAKKLGVPSNPRRGGSSERRFKYTFFPGVKAPGFVLQPSG